MSVCVVCNQEIVDRNHKCPPRVEAARAAAQTKALNEENQEYDSHPIAEHLRLFYGLAIMESLEK